MESLASVPGEYSSSLSATAEQSNALKILYFEKLLPLFLLRTLARFVSSYCVV